MTAIVPEGEEREGESVGCPGHQPLTSVLDPWIYDICLLFPPSPPPPSVKGIWLWRGGGMWLPRVTRFLNIQMLLRKWSQLSEQMWNVNSMFVAAHILYIIRAPLFLQLLHLIFCFAYEKPKHFHLKIKMLFLSFILLCFVWKIGL